MQSCKMQIGFDWGPSRKLREVELQEGSILKSELLLRGMQTPKREQISRYRTYCLVEKCILSQYTKCILAKDSLVIPNYRSKQGAACRDGVKSLQQAAMPLQLYFNEKHASLTTQTNCKPSPGFQRLIAARIEKTTIPLSNYWGAQSIQDEIWDWLWMLLNKVQVDVTLKKTIQGTNQLSLHWCKNGG